MTLPVDAKLDFYVDWDKDGYTAGDKITTDIATGQSMLGASDPESPIAEVGELTLTLTNHDRRFTPGSGGPHDGKLLPKLPVKLEADLGAGGIKVLWTGFTVDWKPESQKYGSRFAELVCEDRMRDYQDADQFTLPLQQNTKAADLLKLITAATYETGAAVGEILIFDTLTDGDTITIGGITYTLKTTLGAIANQVKINENRYHKNDIGTTSQGLIDAAENLAAAINLDFGSGTYYAAGTERHPQVTATGTPGSGFGSANIDGGADLQNSATNYVKLAALVYGITVYDQADPDLPTRYIYLYLQKTGSPTGVDTVRLLATTPFVTDVDPTNATLLHADAVGTFNEADVPGAGGWVKVTLANEVILPGKCAIFAELSTTRSASGTDYISWKGDTTAIGKRGWASYHNGTIWTYPPGTLDNFVFYIPGVVKISAIARGAWANTIALAKTGSAISLSGATLSGGADAPAGMTPDFDPGVRTIEYSGDTWQADLNAMAALEDVARSDGGKFFIARDGDPTYRDTDYLSKVHSLTAITVNNTQIGFNPHLSLDSIVNQATVRYSARRVVLDQIMVRAPETIKVPGGATYDARWNTWKRKPGGGVRVITIPFVEGATGNKIGALSLDPPIPGTNFTISDFPGAGGFDYTYDGLVKFNWAIAGGALELQLTNKALGPLYIFNFTMQGDGLITYEDQLFAFENASSIATYGRRAGEGVFLPFPVGDAYPEVLAEWLANRRAIPKMWADQITFQSLQNAASANLLTVEIGSLLAVTEYQTATAAQKFMVTGIEMQFDAEALTEITFYLYTLPSHSYWLLGKTGFGELGSKTYLGL